MSHSPSNPREIKSGLAPALKGVLALAWFTFVPIMLLVRQRHDRGVFYLGTLFGFGYFSGSFWFLNHIFPGCGFLVALIWAPQPGLWLWLVSKLRNQLSFPDPLKAQADAPSHLRQLKLTKALTISLASAILWATLEWSRSWIFSGLPWNGLEISQVYTLAILKNVSFIGPIGLCFLISFINTSIAESIDQYLLFKQSKKEIKAVTRSGVKHLFFTPLIAIASLIASSLIAHSIAPDQKPDSSIRVGLIQGNFDPYYKNITPDQYAFHMQTYQKLSMEALEQNPDILFWPETPLPSSWLYDKNFQSLVRQVAQHKQTPMIFGTSYYDEDPKNADIKYHFNSALGVNGKGTIQHRYNKIHTVPYGEYMPFRYFMSDELYAKVDKMRGMGTSLNAGTEYTIFDMPKQSRLGVNICFDDIFSDTSRGFANNGANILSTITNDSWFHQSAGGAQHTAQSILRAVETGLPLIRCGNTSESMIILPSGEISAILLNPKDQSRFTRGTLVKDLAFVSKPEPTFYLKHPFLSTLVLTSFSFIIIFFLIWQGFQRKQELLKKALSSSES